MIKYEFKGETYYYHNGKYVDSNFIEVDISTRQELVKMTGIPVNEETVRKRTQTTNNVYRRTLTPIQQTNPYIGMRKETQQNYTTAKYQEPNLDNFEEKERKQKTASVENKKVDEIVIPGLKEPKMSDYGLTQRDIDRFNELMAQYKAEDDRQWKRKKEYENERDSSFVKAIVTFIVVLILFVAIGQSTGAAVGGFIVGFLVAWFVREMLCPKQEFGTITRSRYIDDNLYNKVTAYKNAVDSYNGAVRQTSKSYWDNMNGFDFEEAVAKLFRRKGATAIVTQKQGDHGIDIEVQYKGVWYAVQCKHHANPVGPGPVRELRGVVQGKYKKGIFVSLNGYTQAVRDENSIADNRVILIDRSKLIRIAMSESLDTYLL